MGQRDYQAGRVCSYSASSVLCCLLLWPQAPMDIPFLRTLPDIQELLEPLENAISKVLIPAITEHRCTALDRDILALPVRLGGLGMINPCLDANLEQSSSVKVTIPPVQQILAQSHQMPDDSLVKPLQQAMRSERATVLQDRAEYIRGVAPQKVQGHLPLLRKKGHLFG